MRTELMLDRHIVGELQDARFCHSKLLARTTPVDKSSVVIEGNRRGKRV
jgi:hypothetical protein